MRLIGSKRSWELDHSLDDVMELERKDTDISTISGGSSRPPYAEEPTTLFETAEEKKARKRSHWIAYATMFVMTAGFSVVLSGVWPYLEQLEEGNEELSKTALGWVVAANPFGQMIASPIVGALGNRLGKIRQICYFTVTCYIFGNLLYSFLPLMTDYWDHSAYHLMILSRFIVGISSSNVTLCRSYLASSTTVKERTQGIAIISAAQSLGFVVGPAIQTVLSLTVPDAYKYRSAGWVAAILGCINFVLLMPFIFQEFNIAEKERNLLKKTAEAALDHVKAIPKIDYIAVFSVLFAFFMNQFIYVLLETLMEPFLTDQYEWCDDIAVVVVGVSFVIAGFLAVAMFITATRLARKYDERKILLFGALIPITIGLFMFQPWGPGELTYCESKYFSSTTEPATTAVPPMQLPPKLHAEMYLMDHEDADYIDRLLYDVYNNGSSSVKKMKTFSSHSSTKKEEKVWCDEDECLGCPSNQTWCIGYPSLPLAQFFVAFFIVILGYPYGVSMSNSIFSKLLGPRPQGTWMGILTASGSLSRVTGPIFVSYVYTNLGTRWCFGILFVGMIISMIELLIFYPRLVPMKMPSHDKNKGKV